MPRCKTARDWPTSDLPRLRSPYAVTTGRCPRGQRPVPPAQPLSWFLAQHDEIRARTHQIVSTWNDPAQVRPREDTEFTRRWLLHHVLTHEAYHGGQAVLLSILHGQR